VKSSSVLSPCVPDASVLSHIRSPTRHLWPHRMKLARISDDQPVSYSHPPHASRRWIAGTANNARLEVALYALEYWQINPSGELQRSGSRPGACCESHLAGLARSPSARAASRSVRHAVQSQQSQGEDNPPIRVCDTLWFAQVGDQAWMRQ